MYCRILLMYTRCDWL